MMTQHLDRSNGGEATFKNLLIYGYCIIHLFDPNAQDDLGFNCQPWNSQPHCVSIFQIYHMDYPDLGFTKLKYSDIFVAPRLILMITK